MESGLFVKIRSFCFSMDTFLPINKNVSSGFQASIMKHLSLCLAAALLGGAAVSKAAVVYTTEGAFTGQIKSPNYFNNFESLTSGSQGSSSISLSGNGYGLTISTEGAGNQVYVLPNSQNVPSGQAIGTSGYGTDLILTFTSGNVSAVGANFFLTDIADRQTSGSLTLTLSDSTVVNLSLSATDEPFRGFTTSSGNWITSLRIHPGANYASIDNLYVGEVAPVPELSTGFSAALLGLFVFGRSLIKRFSSKRRS